jgi:hypothetical protein
VHAVVGVVSAFIALWVAAIVFRRTSPNFADYL